jgi:hypothetical protein
MSVIRRWPHAATKVLRRSRSAILPLRSFASLSAMKSSATDATECWMRRAASLDRASWLRVAQGWLSLLKKPPQTLEEMFDELLADKGTGQEDTKSQN